MLFCIHVYTSHPLTIHWILSRSQYWSMQLAAFTYNEAEKNAGNSYTPFAMLIAWLTWPERKARTKDRGVVSFIATESVYMVHIGNRCVHSPVATLHTHLSDFMNVLHASFYRAWPTVSRITTCDTIYVRCSLRTFN